MLRFDRLIENILQVSTSSIVSRVSAYSSEIGFSILLLELVIGAMLLTGVKIRLAAVIALFTLSIFTLITILIGDTVSGGDCGCFGILAPRSTTVSVIENIVFMILAAALISSPPRKEKRFPKSVVILIAAGLVWMGLFHFFPPSWSALRVGSVWGDTPAEPPLPQADSFLIWLMSPECLDCQAKTSFINQLASQSLTIMALTDATKGRVEEYIYDWEPHFNLHRIKADRMKRFGLRLGSLFSVRNGRVTEIWEQDDFNLIGEY